MSSAKKPPHATLTKLSATPHDTLKQELRELQKPTEELAQRTQPSTTPPHKTTVSSEETVTLRTSKGEVKLTDAKIEKWLADTEKALQAEVNKNKPGSLNQQTKIASDRDLAAKFIGRYGIQDMNTLKTFMNSAAGATLRKEAADALAENEAIKAERAFEEREKRALRQRQLAYSMAAAMYRRSAKAKELNRAYAEAGQKAIERSKKSATGESYASSEASDSAAAALAQQYAAYAHAINALQQELTAARTQLPVLQKQLAAIQQKYQVFGKHIAQSNTHVQHAMSNNLTQTQVINAMQARISHLQRQIKHNNSAQARLSKNSNNHQIVLVISQENMSLVILVSGLQERMKKHQSDVNHPISFEDRMEFIEGQISVLHRQIHKQIKIMSELAAITGKEHEAMAMIEELQGLHIQVGNMMDRLAVLKKEKVLFDENFEETDSFEKAAYILPVGQRIVKDENGKHYLLVGSQRLDSMFENEKKRAHQDFQHAISDGATLQKLVNNNETTEVSAKKKQIGALQGRISFLDAQLKDMQEEQAELGKNPSKSPAPVFSLGQTTPKPVPSETWLQIENLLEKLKKNPQKEDVQKLRDLIPKDNRRLYNLINGFGKALNANNQVEMQSYLQTIERSAVSAYKPFVTSVTSPQKQKSSEFQSSSESESVKPFNPSPFKDPYSPY